MRAIDKHPWLMNDNNGDDDSTWLSTQEAAEKLSELGIQIRADDVARLAKFLAFPNAKKDSSGHWRIPLKDVENYWKRRKRRQWIKVGSLVGSLAAIFTFLFTVISGSKDALDYYNDYVSPDDTSVSEQVAISPPTEEMEAIEISNVIFGVSDTKYLVKITINNPFTVELLVKGISLQAKAGWNIQCTTPPPKTYEFSDSFIINGTEGESIKFIGSVTDKDLEGYRYPVIGTYYDNQCNYREFTLDFDTSFVMAPKTFSTFHLLFPKQLKVIEQSNTEKLEADAIYQDEGDRIPLPQYKTLEVDINTNMGNLTYEVALPDLDSK